MSHPSTASESSVRHEAVEDLIKRVNMLRMRMSYQNWLKDFKEPLTYKPQSYHQMGLKNNYLLYFGSESETDPALLDPGARLVIPNLKVPVTLLCSISEPLYNIIATHFRDPQRKPIFDKSEAYPFWWLMNFLRNVCCVPNAEGLARLLQMGHKYEIQPVVQLSRSYLAANLDLGSFAHVLNAAVQTKDEEFLIQCSCMVAAWSDELLSSPYISVLSFQAMFHLLKDPHLSPSSELMVFNAIAQWYRNRVDVLSAAQLHICLKKVRFLLFTEEEFQRDVLPSGVFPLNEARVMSEIIRHAPGSENATLSLIHDRQLQQTRRPMMLKSVVVTKELQWDQAEYLYYKLSHIREIRPLGYFTVDKHILLRRIRSVSFLNEEAGTLKLQENGGFKIDRPWKHGSCTFEKPIPLHPNISYHLAYESDNWRAEITNFRVNLEQCVGGVWFKGMFFCSHFLLEFSRFYTADLETTDKVWVSMRPVEDETLMKNYKAIRSIFSRMFNYGPSTSRGLRRTREGQISEASGAELGANNSSNAEGDSDNGAASDGRAASPVTGNPDVDTNATDEVLSSVVLQLAEGTEEEMEELPS